MGTNRYQIINRLVHLQLFIKLFLGLIIGASPGFLLAQELTQNAVSSGAGLVSGGNYTGYASAGQMATYMYANGTQIATQGIILNEISSDVEFTFELSGNLTENEDLNSGALVMKAAKIALAGSPLVNTKVFLLDSETGEILYETETDLDGFFSFGQIPYRDFYFTVGTSEVPEEPVLLTFEENPIFVKNIEINGEVGTTGLTTSIVVTPKLTSGNEVEETKLRYIDRDKDGFGYGTTLIRLNINDSEIGYSENNIDCDDTDASINHDAKDVPGSGIDANCDDYFLWFIDSDHDGFGGAETISSVNETPGEGESNNNLDCDDSNSAINPEAYDPPDGSIDANCDGIFGCQEITSVLFNASHDPVETNNIVSISATIIGDKIKSASWDWGDNSSNSATISNYEITGSHSYTIPGVYVVTLTIKNYCGESYSYPYKYFVIYDPTGGFVTGSGAINSPLGASYAHPNETGIATFGFVSKYVKNKTVPIGNTEFEFEAGDLNFASTEYEWLVVAGSKAKFKGRGTVNGVPGYQFMISAIDADSKGNPDLFRIKIWNEITLDVVYDNQMDDEIDADPSTEIMAGSIKIHTPKTKSESILTSTDMDSFDGEGFTVYPNPTSGIVKINGFQSDREYLIKVIDMTGREIKVKKNSDFETEIDLTNFSKGIYNLVIQYETEIKTFSIIRK